MSVTVPQVGAPDWYKQTFEEGGGDRLQEVRRMMSERLVAQLDKLAAAYILETALPPSQIELVQETNGLVTRWFYRPRS